ncbi:hypothetical protein [Sorangium sp. So ce124]|uniref:hypothetical protein n=1 Tax=Sorangium sp. So ce124 TaxID=3133280 RepID=UPI003F60B586
MDGHPRFQVRSEAQLICSVTRSCVIPAAASLSSHRRVEALETRLNQDGLKDDEDGEYIFGERLAERAATTIAQLKPNGGVLVNRCLPSERHP